VSNPATSPKPAFEAPSDLTKVAVDFQQRRMTAMRCRLDRPAVAAATTAPRVDGMWVIDLDLNDRQADGQACIRCGQRDGPMVPVGWAERPTNVLRRIGVTDDARNCQIFAHVECQETP
jgi:hypothetical protein